jgi:hypothetical protein
METIYFKTRKDMTNRMSEYLSEGFDCYRVRIPCKCRTIINNHTQNFRSNQRNGVMVLSGDTVVKILVRCKICHEKESKQKILS